MLRDKGEAGPYGELHGDDLLPLAEALIHEVSTMTIATCSSDSPWAAPVYYVYRKGGFYFFSSPSSRHIIDALNSSGSAACSIHAQASSWKKIRGLQMAGEIYPVAGLFEGTEAVAFYLKKFPFTLEFFKAGDFPDMNAFSERFGVRLYVFRPNLTLYCDNSIGFGFRKEILLPP